MHPHVHSSIIYNSQGIYNNQVSADGWMNTEDVVYVYNGILLSHKKKNEILPFATAWMDCEGIMLSEISQTNKDKYL